MLDLLNSVTNRGRNVLVDANRLAEGLFGSHMAVNMFMTGIAYQGGLIPDFARSHGEGRGVERRRYRAQPAGVRLGPQILRRRRVGGEFPQGRRQEPSQHSIAWPNWPNIRTRPTLRLYVEFLDKVTEPALRDAVAKYLYKLMAYKDEYEVARLLTKPEFEQRVRDMWAAPEAISYNLHPPLLRSFGVHKKLKLGSWFRTPLLMLEAA